MSARASNAKNAIKKNSGKTTLKLTGTLIPIPRLLLIFHPA
jgi:hypothetical protein